MLKRSLCVVCVVGLMAGAVSAQDNWEFAYEGTTVPTPGASNTLLISLVNNTDADFPIGGVFLDPLGAGATADIKYNLDTDFAWAPWLDGSADPTFGQFAYFATVNPPQTANGLADLFAVVAPAFGSVPVASLEWTGNTLGTFPLVIGLPDGANSALAGGEQFGFANVPVGNTEVLLTVLPEPATLSLLGIGGLMFLRRRR